MFKRHRMSGAPDTDSVVIHHGDLCTLAYLFSRWRNILLFHDLSICAPDVRLHYNMIRSVFDDDKVVTRSI